MDFVLSLNDIVNYDIFMKRSENPKGKGLIKVAFTAISHQKLSERKPVFGAGSNMFQAVEENVKLVGGVILEPALFISPLEDFITKAYGEYRQVEEIDPVDILIQNKYKTDQGYFLKEVYFIESKGDWNIQSVGKVNKLEYFAKNAYYLSEIKDSGFNSIQDNKNTQTETKIENDDIMNDEYYYEWEEEYYG